MRLHEGQQFAGYRVVRKLGRGGMATVYLAKEGSFDRHVALKVLPDDLADDAGFVARFHQEAQTIGGLEHPNIVPLYRFGIDDGVPWMALRFVDGGDLAHRLSARPLAIAEGLAVLHALAAALDYAHRRGVVHRDLKPQNVLLTGEGQVYLADFGVAKLLEGSAIAKTHTGGIVGTPAYMAPEQAQGQAVTKAVDIYALGVIAFQWLTGALPFDADTPHAILIKHVMEPLPDAPLASLPPAVAGVLRRALAKAPEQRHASASALVGELDAALRGAPFDAKATATPASDPTTPPHPRVEIAATVPAGAVATAARPAPRVPWRGLFGFAFTGALLYAGVLAYQGYAEDQAEQARQAAWRDAVPGHYEGFAADHAFNFDLDAGGTGKSAWSDGSPYESNLTWKQAGLIVVEKYTVGLPVPYGAAPTRPDWKTLTLLPEKMASGEYLETGNDDRIVRKATPGALPWPQIAELPADWLARPLDLRCGAEPGAQDRTLELYENGSALLGSRDDGHAGVWAANPGPTGSVFVLGDGFALQLGKLGDTVFASGQLFDYCRSPHYALGEAPPAG